MTKKDTEAAWAAQVDRAVALWRDSFSRPSISEAEDHRVQAMRIVQRLTPRRRREFMEELYRQIEMQFAEDAADEIIFGGAEPFDPETYF